MQVSYCKLLLVIINVSVCLSSQGIWMGWLTAAGSLARTLGPVFVSQVYDFFGPRVTFVSLIVVIILSIIGFIAVFRRLVPYSTNRSILVQEP